MLESIFKNKTKIESISHATPAQNTLRSQDVEGPTLVR